MTITAQHIEVSIDLIDAGPNDRQAFDPDALRELADSIAAHGLAQPPTLRPRGDRFEIVAGERRFRAVRLLGWSHVPALVRKLSDSDASAIMLAENLQRADLDPIEEARAYASRMDRFGSSVAEVAILASVPEPRVRERICLLKLNPEIAEVVSRKLLPLRFAACMTPLDVNRQRIAFRAYDDARPDFNVFKALCARLLSEQQQETMFDPDSFLSVEDYLQAAETAVDESSTIDEMNADPVGAADIAKRLGVKQQTVAQWRYRGIFPEPRWTVSGMPVWQWSDIKKWHKAREAKKGSKARS